jgi:hypothetical protein
MMQIFTQALPSTNGGWPNLNVAGVEKIKAPAPGKEFPMKSLELADESARPGLYARLTARGKTRPLGACLDSHATSRTIERKKDTMADPTEVKKRVQRGTGGWIEFSGELDLRCLAELKATLRAELSSRRPVFVDLSEVSCLVKVAW